MNVVKPRVIDRAKILPPEAVAAASWRKSPQTVRLWKSKQHARSMMVMGRAIARAAAKNAPVMEALRRDALLCRQADALPPHLPDSGRAGRAALLTPAQAVSVETVQQLAREIGRLGDLINQQNVLFDLGLPPLRLSELTAHLAAVDGIIGAARRGAKKMGVQPVVDNFKQELKNVGNVEKQSRAA
ncbi:hypothetical protein [Neisseria dentiae]|uniref:hypothetical protein n=1 Tax=Neisseria dentiae TaxID=194197 RepID=UPI0035A13460